MDRLTWSREDSARMKDDKFLIVGIGRMMVRGYLMEICKCLSEVFPVV